MTLNIREYLLIIITGIAAYSFIKIFLSSHSSIKESEKIRRESVLIYSMDKNKEKLSKEIEGMIIEGVPDKIFESRNGDFIIIDTVEFMRQDQEGFYKSQMGLYFLLVEKIYNRRPSYGIIENKRNNRFLKIDNADELRSEVLRSITGIRKAYSKDENIREIHRNHEESSRCSACPYRVDCDESLSL
ncbi:MAG: Dna2/Cas4 domain-containing protein [Spirochaetes bacterium]|nr:Dna2/Cas4 domain-containing protein [Spirochaetota bacterium]